MSSYFTSVNSFKYNLYSIILSLDPRRVGEFISVSVFDSDCALLFWRALLWCFFRCSNILVLSGLVMFFLDGRLGKVRLWIFGDYISACIGLA